MNVYLIDVVIILSGFSKFSGSPACELHDVLEEFLESNPDSKPIPTIER